MVFNQAVTKMFQNQRLKSFARTFKAWALSAGGGNGCPGCGFNPKKRNARKLGEA